MQKVFDSILVVPQGLLIVFVLILDPGFIYQIDCFLFEQTTSVGEIRYVRMIHIESVDLVG